MGDSLVFGRRDLAARQCEPLEVIDWTRTSCDLYYTEIVNTNLPWYRALCQHLLVWAR
jgi:hypothetical protein